MSGSITVNLSDQLLEPPTSVSLGATAESLTPELRDFARIRLERALEEFIGSTPDVDVTELLLMSQRTRLRQAAAKKDGTPRLFREGDEGVVWADGLLALEDHLRWTTYQPDARIKIPVDPNVVPLEKAIEETVEEMKRLRIAIRRNGTEEEKSEALYRHFFADLSTPRTRPVALATVASIRMGIAQPPANAPLWLNEFDERFEYVQSRLCVAYDGRNKPKTVKLWSAEVQIAALALSIALGDFLSWAATTATNARLKQFERVITPRQRSDGSSTQAASDAPAENETSEQPTDEEREIDENLEPVDIGGMDDESEDTESEGTETEGAEAEGAEAEGAKSEGTESEGTKSEEAVTSEQATGTQSAQAGATPQGAATTQSREAADGLEGEKAS